MQLLKITSTPIKYRIESEKATLTVTNGDPGKNTPVQVQNQKITIPKDESSYKNNIKSDNKVNNDNKKIRADKSFDKEKGIDDNSKMDSVYQYNRINSKVYNRNKISQPVIRDNTASDIDIAFSQVKSVKPDDSWEPDKRKEEYSDADADYSAKKELKFTPASYKLIVEEYADVKIEYLGGIDYFPDSSAPDYEKPDDK